jgi:hypothetical protein
LYALASSVTTIRFRFSVQYLFADGGTDNVNEYSVINEVNPASVQLGGQSCDPSLHVFLTVKVTLLFPEELAPFHIIKLAGNVFVMVHEYQVLNVIQFWEPLESADKRVM